jgi:cell division septation protein DedD
MVQVSSFKKMSHARALESKLRRKGYSAFVMGVEVSKAKGVWYRVFLGKYQTEANARAVAQEAQSRHKLKTIVLKSSR